MTKIRITRLYIMAVFSVLTGIVNAQNVDITDDDGYSAEPSAMLDVKSTTKG
ncbi:MAG: hypothetical protein KJ607_11095 [Bacteroidetes bacterium]|nr:hypothetical protein [Bacteroidota bacterium]